MPHDRVDVDVEDPAWSAALPDAEDLVRQAAGMALAEREEGGATVLLTDDDTVHDLNASFRGVEAPTNVLAFPAGPNLEGFVGDIALAYGVCAREAAAQGKPLADHLRHLVIHGVLHLLGYDHQHDAQASEMESRERLLLAALGVPDPYAPESACGDEDQAGPSGETDVATHAVRHG